MEFFGAKNDKLLRVLHEIVEEDKGKKFTFKGSCKYKGRGDKSFARDF
jgi:hypothetical protein